MDAQTIVYLVIAALTALALLGFFIFATRADKRHDDQNDYEGEVIGDASLLDRPEPRNPFRQQHPREEEPMGM